VLKFSCNNTKRNKDNHFRSRKARNKTCRKCGKMFASHQALGGHISKAHPQTPTSTETTTSKKRRMSNFEYAKRIHASIFKKKNHQNTMQWIKVLV